MSIVKVEVGSPFTMTVKAARDADGKFGAQIAFDDAEGNTIFAGRDTALRQLERIGLTQTSVVGKALLFEKVQKDGKTYLNINPARQGNGKSSGGGSAQARERSGAVQGTAGTGRVSRPLGVLYADCLSLAASTVRQALGKDVSNTDIIAAAATVFIQATKSDVPLRAAANAPPVKQPVPSDDFEEFPGALQDEDDDLPF